MERAAIFSVSENGERRPASPRNVGDEELVGTRWKPERDGVRRVVLTKDKII